MTFDYDEHIQAFSLFVAELNPLELPRLPYSERSNLPAIEAVYFVYRFKLKADLLRHMPQIKKPICLYVGSSHNLARRFYGHSKSRFFEPDDYIYFFAELLNHFRTDVEMHFINKLNPSLNHDRGQISLTFEVSRTQWNRLRLPGETDEQLFKRLLIR